MSIDLENAFRSREILITGVTGFLGKVALTLLLDRYPEVGKVYVLVRPRAGGSAEDRFFGKVIAFVMPTRSIRPRLRSSNATLCCSGSFRQRSSHASFWCCSLFCMAPATRLTADLPHASSFSAAIIGFGTLPLPGFIRKS